MPELASQPLEAHAGVAPPRHAAIASVAMRVPDRIVGNAQIADRLGIEPE